MTHRRGLLALGLTLSLGLAACSSQGGAPDDDGGGNSGAGGVDTERYTIAMITHEAPGDTFWDKIRAGAEDAAGALNVDLKYSNDREPGAQASLVQNAEDSDVDGIAVTLAYASQVGQAAQKAAQDGTPVVAFNSGITEYQKYGALMYFGSDENLAGETAGQRIAEDNGEKAICVVQEQGSVALEARCAGVKKGFPNTENLNVDGTQLTAVRSTIEAKLQQDPSITHVVTLGAPIALTALEAKGDAGTDTKIITFDLNEEAAQKIADGDIEFSIDQQPYVQGFMAVQSLWAYLSNGNDIGGGGPVLTGPSFVDADNIEQILPYAKNNTR